VVGGALIATVPRGQAHDDLTGGLTKPQDIRS